MVDIVRPVYGEAWASVGEKVSPTPAKIQGGWIQEMMPYQWENFLQNRQDTALLYVLQKGVPEWDASQEYIAGKSVVTYQTNLYISVLDSTNVLPTVQASWKRLNPSTSSSGLVTIAGGGTGASTAADARTNLGLGTIATATAPTSDGVVVRSAADTLISRSITGTANNIVVTNGDGVAGNINVNVGSNVALLNTDSSWTSTGSIKLPSGSTSEQGTATPGKIRFNNETGEFHGAYTGGWKVLAKPSTASETTIVDSGDYYTSGNVEGALQYVGETLSDAILSFLDYAAASAAAATLPDGQHIEALDTDGRSSQYIVQSGALVFVDYAPDTIRLTSYAALRAYSGSADTCNIIADAISGVFMNRGTTPGATDNGGTRIIDAVGRLWERKFSGAVMIPWFTQGTANDTVALQEAFAAGKAVRDGGAGYAYNINGTIQLQDGQNMLFSGAEFKQLGTQKPMFDAKGKRRIRCSYGRFTGLLEPIYINSPSSQAICFAIEGADDVNVSDCEFENFMYSPIMSNAGANNVTFKGNRVRGPGAGVLGVDVNRRNTTGCTLNGSNIRIHANDISATATGIIIGQGSTEISVTGNIIHDLINEHGIYADTGMKNLTITGNVVRNVGVAGVGIKVQHYDSFGALPENIVISSNTIFSCGSDGILVINTAGTSLYATGVSITGNTISNAVQHGIDVRNARGCTVSGNSVEQVGQSGIYISHCTVLSVSGNTIRVTGSHGIFDDGLSGDVTISNNILNTVGTDNTKHCGMFIQGVSEHNIVGNIIRCVSTGSLYSLFISAAPSGLSTTTVRANTCSGSNGVAMRFPVGAGQLRYFGENVLQSIAGNNIGQSIPEVLQRGTEEHVYFGTAFPTSGTWPQGAKVISRYPAAGGAIGWVCVVGGSPGVWKSFGTVAA